MGKFRALSTVQTFVVKSMSSPVEKWMTKGSVSSLPPLHYPSGVESGVAAQKLANNSQQWRHNKTHWTHSQGGSWGLCNLKREEASQEETHPWRTQGGVKGISVLFSPLRGWTDGQEQALSCCGYCVCLWNLLNSSWDLTFRECWAFCVSGTQLKSQLTWHPSSGCPNSWQRTGGTRFTLRSTRMYPRMVWATFCWHHVIALVRAVLFAGIYPLCGWISSCSVSSCLSLSCQDLIVA